MSTSGMTAIVSWAIGMPVMIFHRTSQAPLRWAIACIALLAMMLGPIRAGASAADCSPSQDCSAACGTPLCCEQMPAPQKDPVAPVHQTGGSDFCIALMSAARPLLGLLPTERHHFVRPANAPLGRSPASLALLCMRLV